MATVPTSGPMAASNYSMRSIRKWSPEMECAMRDCCDTPDWDVLLDLHGEDVEGMKHCFPDYLNFCVDVVSPTRTVQCYPKSKPWVTQQVKTAVETGRH